MLMLTYLSNLCEVGSVYSLIHQPQPTATIHDMETIRAHVWVSGKVHGVGYRAACRERATAVQVTGWVRNLPNGQVEAVFEGREDPVEDLVGWCQQGPDAAVVKGVEIEYEASEGLTTFEIR
jgi:acylphosphatase